jgi:predicted RNA-binding protein with RPS1 domain
MTTATPLAARAIMRIAMSAAIASVMAGAAFAADCTPSKWGADDEIGSANLVTPERVAAAAALVKQGKSVGLGIVIDSTTPAFAPRGLSVQVVQPNQQGGQRLTGFGYNATYNDDIAQLWFGIGSQIDGLGHLSDISWDESGEDALRSFKKGDEVETVVLSVDPERERISLGIKQLDKDPFSSFVAVHEKGSIVNGTITEVDAKGAAIDLGDGVEGYLRASEISRDRVEDARAVLKVGEEVEAKFLGVDRKNRSISLSIKAKDMADEQAAIKGYAREAQAGTATLGDILKQQMEEAAKD